MPDATAPLPAWFCMQQKDTHRKSARPLLIQNLLILSTLQKISGKQREVLVCALLFTAGRKGEGEMRDAGLPAAPSSWTTWKSSFLSHFYDSLTRSRENGVETVSPLVGSGTTCPWLPAGQPYKDSTEHVTNH